MELAVQHKLQKDEALKRIKGLLEETKFRFADKFSGLKEDWNGDKCSFDFSAVGFSVTGEIIVDSSEVRILGKIPFAALPFRGKIESIIKEEAKKLLS